MATAHMPDTSTAATTEGVKAHEEAERILKHEVYDIKDNYIAVYVDFVRNAVAEVKGDLYIEEQFDFSYIREGESGSSDAIVLADGYLHVIDLKYGQLAVDIEENYQLMGYALGAYNKFDMLYNIQTVKATIVQPRLDRISTVDISLDRLKQFEKDLKKAVKNAFSKNPTFSPSEKACQWCKVKATCGTRAKQALEIVRLNYQPEDPKQLSLDDIGNILKYLPNVEKWIKDIKDFAFTQAMHGVKIPEFKLVLSNGQSKWTASAATALKEYPELFETSLIGITEAKKILGKNHDIFSNYLEKSQGKPTLVHVSDKRPSYSNFASALADFSD